MILFGNNKPVPVNNTVDYSKATDDQRLAWEKYNKDLEGYNRNKQLLSSISGVKTRGDDEYIFNASDTSFLDKMYNRFDDNYNSYESSAGKGTGAGEVDYTNIKLYKPTYSGPQLQNKDAYMQSLQPKVVIDKPVEAEVNKAQGTWVKDTATGKMVLVGANTSNQTYVKGNKFSGYYNGIKAYQDGGILINKPVFSNYNAVAESTGTNLSFNPNLNKELIDREEEKKQDYSNLLDVDFREKWGISRHAYRMSVDQEYAISQRKSAVVNSKKYGSIDYPSLDTRREGVVTANTEWMHPNLSGRVKKSNTEFSNEVIAAALPIPGIDKMGKVPNLIEAAKTVKSSNKATGALVKNIIDVASDSKNIVKPSVIAQADTPIFNASNNVKLQKTIEGINNNPKIPEDVKSKLIYNETAKAEKLFNKKATGINIPNKKPDVTEIYKPRKSILDSEGQLNIKIAMDDNKKGIISLANKNGDISIDALKSFINKDGVSKMDKNTINRVLKNHPDGKSIKYEEIRSGIRKDLAEFHSVEIDKYADYGLDKIGYNKNKKLDDLKRDLRSDERSLKLYKERLLDPEGNIAYNTKSIKNYEERVAKLKKDIEDFERSRITENKTITFHSNKLGKGSTDHFSNSPLGHSRYIIDSENPKTLSILESQSDYYQKLGDDFSTDTMNKRISSRKAKLDEIKEMESRGAQMAHGKMQYTDKNHNWVSVESTNVRKAKFENQLDELANYEQKYDIGKNIEERLLQENVKFASEKGLDKVRYPTKETLAKVEGYPKKDMNEMTQSFEEMDLDDIVIGLETEIRQYNSRLNELNNAKFQTTGSVKEGIIKEFDEIKEKVLKLENNLSISKSKRNKLINEREANHVPDFQYSPEHQTILKKYDKTPDKIKKLLNEDAKVVTDSKGNTWYEFKIPDSYKAGKQVIKAGSLGALSTKVVNEINNEN